MNIYFLVIVLSSLIGLLISLYIMIQKRRPHPVACPMRGKCDSVVRSEYSKFVNIPIEYLGIAYYSFVLVSYFVFILVPRFNDEHPLITFLVLILSTVAFLFSLYLTFIQAFLIKEFCTWCLVSASLCTVIFISAVNASSFGFLPFLAEHREWIVGFHIIGLVLGLGGAVFSDILFLRFLKDLKISESEVYVLKTFSQIIWIGLAILIVSGIGLYLPNSEWLNNSSKFITKMIILTIIIVNGVGLNLFITPKLTSIRFGKIAEKNKGLREIRKMSFAMGAISIISWFSVFILGMMRSSPFSIEVLFGVYLLILSVGIISSQIIEQLLNRGKLNPAKL